MWLRGPSRLRGPHLGLNPRGTAGLEAGVGGPRMRSGIIPRIAAAGKTQRIRCRAEEPGEGRRARRITFGGGKQEERRLSWRPAPALSDLWTRHLASVLRVPPPLRHVGQPQDSLAWELEEISSNVSSELSRCCNPSRTTSKNGPSGTELRPFLLRALLKSEDKFLH